MLTAIALLTLSILSLLLVGTVVYVFLRVENLGRGLAHQRVKQGQDQALNLAKLVHLEEQVKGLK